MAEIALGDSIPTIRKTVTQEMIDAWAAVSGDFNPLHTDPEFASQSRFGGTIAHGHLSLSWLCQVVLDWRGLEWLSGGELRDVRFVAPVRPGHAYETRGRVSDLVDGFDGQHITLELEIVDAESQEPCVLGLALVTVR